MIHIITVRNLTSRKKLLSYRRIRFSNIDARGKTFNPLAE